MNTRTILTLVLALATLLGAAAAARADERDELKQRFKERYPTLVQLKKAEKIGETFKGLAAVVKEEYEGQQVDPDEAGGPTIKAFLAEENKDRLRLYQLMAEELKTTPAKIAERDAKRRFEQAKPHEWLQPEKDKWVRKRDLK